MAKILNRRIRTLVKFKTNQVQIFFEYKVKILLIQDI